MKVTISHKERKKIACLLWFVFGLTHFAPKKHTFIVVYCQQIFVADSFKRPFGIYVSHKNSKLIIFFSLTRLYY